MARKTLLRLTALLFCIAFLTEYAAARPAPEVGARRPGERVSAGALHSCALEEDGTVSCWGDNSNGQLGDGTQTQRLNPVTVGGFSNAVAISAGDFHTCALLANGTARCWGGNAGGQLGDGTVVGRFAAVTVQGLSNAIAISAGGSHTCALLVDGTVRCWGNNGGGQLGNGTQTSSVVPLVVSSLTNAVAIDAGFDHTCALIADGTGRCWGRNLQGQLGDGTQTQRLIPVAVNGLSNAVTIGTGKEFSCAALADGKGRCWGNNASGQLGDGTTTRRLTSVAVGLSSNAVAISAGEDHTCALLSNGSAQCWGNNLSGQLGNGTMTSSTVPVSVNLGQQVAVVTGGDHTCGLIVNGTIRCWGFNANGQLGDGSTTQRLTPVSLVVGIGGTILAKSVGAGFNHNCAARHNGNAACWGLNGNGQLGDGTTVDRLTPVAVFDIGNAVTLAPGNSHSCVLRSDGTLRCWGRNLQGYLGDGTTTDRLMPVPVTGFAISGPGPMATALDGGSFHNCALVADGTVRCWGFNGGGRLGDGTTTDRLTPVAVNGLTNTVAITAAGGGGGHTCALRADGTVRCWGLNGSGQLGVGDLISNSPNPVQVLNLGNNLVTAIATGANHTCALLGNGTVRCWGSNSSGQLGDGTTIDRTTPTAVSGLTNAVAISAGLNHTCALIADGTARCWGNNFNGKLGDGTSTTRSTPVTVTTLVTLPFGGVIEVPLSGLVQITTGASHTCASNARGAVFCWGDNSGGQLGDDTTTDRIRPVAVPSFTFNIDPNVVIKRDGKKAQVIALANCDAGAHARIHVELRQGRNVGQGQETVECTGALERYPVKINAHGRDRFTAGAAQAEADAVVRDRRHVIDTQEWTRAVTISVGRFIKHEHDHDDDD